ncbi:MAG: ParB N-terminal domain-containing protein [Desulfobacterales bacterium]|nr:ParB N-terminal domain-containing protein [Desulfobacterales bacterium]
MFDKLKETWRRGRKAREIKSFREDQEREGAFDRVDRGIKKVPVERIVGSVGRYHDFDGMFRLKRHLPRDRFQNMIKAMKNNKPLPPVKLYQIKNEYYVLDGNHRVSAAKELGRHEIDAVIVELLPSPNTLENILYREKSEFEDKTRLLYSIELTEVGQYEYLQKQIVEHQHFLEQQEPGEPAAFPAAAADWYDTIYCPLTGIIKKGSLIRSFPERTIADLYTYISFHQWEKESRRKYGIGIDRLIPKSMAAFRKKMADKKEFEYPDMLREITAFILINVEAKDGLLILEKLFSVKEIQEVHSVHGNVDIIAKLVLRRDLLASDSEVIAQFVEDRIRRINGIRSTTTLIPGFSKQKFT